MDPAEWPELFRPFAAIRALYVAESLGAATFTKVFPLWVLFVLRKKTFTCRLTVAVAGCGK